MNSSRFDMTEKIEKWGTTEDEYVIFYNQALEELCSGTGFSKKSFLSWAVKRGIVLQDSAGKSSRQKKVNGKNMRCVYIKIPDGNEPDENGEIYNGDGTKIDKDGFLQLEEGLKWISLLYDLGKSNIMCYPRCYLKNPVFMRAERVW